MIPKNPKPFAPNIAPPSVAAIARALPDAMSDDVAAAVLAWTCDPRAYGADQ